MGFFFDTIIKRVGLNISNPLKFSRMVISSVTSRARRKTTPRGLSKLSGSNAYPIGGELTQLTKDWFFSTPSGASNSAVVISSYGRREWS